MLPPFLRFSGFLSKVMTETSDFFRGFSATSKTIANLTKSPGKKFANQIMGFAGDTGNFLFTTTSGHVMLGGAAGAAFAGSRNDNDLGAMARGAVAGASLVGLGKLGMRHLEAVEARSTLRSLPSEDILRQRTRLFAPERAEAASKRRFDTMDNFGKRVRKRASNTEARTGKLPSGDVYNMVDATVPDAKNMNNWKRKMRFIRSASKKRMHYAKAHAAASQTLAALPALQTSASRNSFLRASGMIGLGATAYVAAKSDTQEGFVTSSTNAATGSMVVGGAATVLAGIGMKSGIGRAATAMFGSGMMFTGAVASGATRGAEELYFETYGEDRLRAKQRQDLLMQSTYGLTSALHSIRH